MRCAASNQKGVRGQIPTDAALSKNLSGTGFGAFTACLRRDRDRARPIVHRRYRARYNVAGHKRPLCLRASVETVTVTSSKLGGGGRAQSVPISITALSQEQLTSTQTAGGPDLVKQVPNPLTFSKTNFYRL